MEDSGSSRFDWRSSQNRTSGLISDYIRRSFGKHIRVPGQLMRAARAYNRTNGAVFHSDPEPAVRTTASRPSWKASVAVS